MQPIPKVDDAARSGCTSQFHGQWAMAGARHILAKLLLVRRKDADAAPTTRDSHIPLLCICRGLDG